MKIVKGIAVAIGTLAAVFFAGAALIAPTQGGGTRISWRNPDWRWT